MPGLGIHAAASAPVSPAYTPQGYAHPPPQRGRHAWAPQDFDDSLAPDGGAADELPDYATSQREAAERSRRQALSRAAELESRWRGSASGR